ncbi:glycosyltransferase family 2 protein [Neobacillus cucumis]|uniref:Glycosyl transferase family A n=1 Tax=Neobacillus cucumis TaxID=1740721 RepID=A0A2N5H7M5_9BACI|nr:glycosyltransferase family 2 protein [Neobacillus cucumis]PLS01510.1 glycosyl transferase family A [Neobacillus cucumis]
MISVVIPTYNRAKDLSRCLNALNLQLRKPDEIVLVVRDTDIETIRLIKKFNSKININIVYIKEHGQVAALNKGIRNAKGDIVSITDDDTEPLPDWLERIEGHFKRDLSIGGVGGRDWVFHGQHKEIGNKKIVGKIQWFGRVIGNHHLGYGEAREVDVLKGANMSYRMTAIKGLSFNTNLKGSGAQVYNDMDFSLSVKKNGWKLMYDPAVAVNHYPGVRSDEDKRNLFNSEAFYNAVHNETYILHNNFKKINRCIYFVWSLFIGTTANPGLLQFIRYFPKEGKISYTKLITSYKARYSGLKTLKSVKKNISTPL